MKIIKIQIPGKVYFNGFLRQLKELYYFLHYRGYISCTIEEFFTHFTGKKFTPTPKPKGKLEWNKEKYLIPLLTAHLMEKRFLDDDNLNTHFRGVSGTDLKSYRENKTSSPAKKLKRELDILFPAASGYRCKERLYYKARNKQSLPEMLAEMGLA